MAENFQELLIKEVREFLLPIRATRGHPDAIFTFLETIGWYIRPSLQPNEAQFTGAFNDLIQAISTFADTTGNSIETLDDLRDAFENVIAVVDAIDTLSQTLPNLSGLDPGEFVADVLNALAVLYIHRNYPLLFAILDLLTLIYLEPPAVETDSNGDVVRVRNQFAKLRFDKIGDVIADTQGVVRDAYWPNGIADRAEAIAVARRLFPRVVHVLKFISEKAPVRASFGRGIEPATLSPDDEDRLSAMLSLLWDRYDPETGLSTSLGASVGILAASDGGPGAFVVPFGALDVKHRIGRWLVMLSGSYEAPGFKITNAGVDNYSGGNEVPHAALVLAPEASSQPGLLIGSATGTRLEAQKIWIEADAIFSKPDFEISTFLRLREGALVVGGGDGDGFLKKILPADGLRVDFDLGLGWSNLRGFHIEGSGSFEFRVPLHVSLGPIEIPALTIRAGFANGELPIAVGCDVRAKLGPLTAVVENMGVRLDFSFPPEGGNLGVLNWEPAFKPPSGIGLSIDGGGFSGGGFISFEPELHRYSGLLELQFQSGFALKAIGLLNTELPGGEPGFSLLIIISAEFAPIQIGYGFTLTGVGGLLGLNRTTDIDVLRAGVKTGALNSVLFPVDIVANASQIISDLRQIFPPAADRFIFGPMAKLGWGTPTLVHIELGLMVEGMSPWRILLPGVVRVVLPDKDNVILKLQVNFLGTWEEEKKTITFYASLYDSRILTMALTGDMAFLMTYGSDPSFLIAAGGFHPAFVPPPLPFPPFSRLSLVIIDDSDLRIILSSYFAVTSNTAQIGCSVDLTATQGKYSVEGHLGFDALFQFTPFAMIVTISATLTLRRKSKVLFGVEVYGTLSGPTPWSAHGTATFTILKVDITFEFSKVWGENRNTTLQSVDVFSELMNALDNRGNWEAVLPGNAQNLVTLKAPDPQEAALLVLRPDGALAVKQKVVPLDFTISLFGNQQPQVDRRFTIKRIHVAGTDFDKDSIQDEFAPAQFESLSDAQKLSRKSFEKMSAGAKTRGINIAARTSAALRRQIAYETKVVDSRILFYWLPSKLSESASAFARLQNGNSSSRYAGSYFNAQSAVNEFGPVVSTQESFSVVHTANLRMLSQATAFGSQAGAHDHMARLLAGDPSLEGTIQVVPNFQARKAA